VLQELLARVQAISEEMLKKGSTAVWYRGHRKSEWELKSTLHRHLDRLTSGLAQPLPPELMKETLREEAKTLYRRFQVEAWPLLRETERSDWGVLLAMQHVRQQNPSAPAEHVRVPDLEEILTVPRLWCSTQTK
jgi:hypothetical protein